MDALYRMELYGCRMVERARRVQMDRVRSPRTSWSRSSNDRNCKLRLLNNRTVHKIGEFAEDRTGRRERDISEFEVLRYISLQVLALVTMKRSASSARYTSNIPRAWCVATWERREKANDLQHGMLSKPGDIPPEGVPIEDLI